MRRLLKELLSALIVGALVTVALSTIALHAVSPGGPLVGWGYKSALSPTQMQAAYGMGSLLARHECGGKACDGHGQTVALIEQGTFDASDVATYSLRWGLPKVDLAVSRWDADKGQFAPAAASHAPGDSEAVMDIDAVHTLAPGASIHVYEFGQGTGGVESFTAYLDAVAAAPRFESVLSISEGACDGTVDTAVLQALDTKLKVLAGQGRTVFASSGDDGASCSGGGVQFPASDPYVTAVGGTSLHVSGGHAQESSWDDGRQGKGGGVGSSGGGTSAYFGRPAWQAGIAPSGKGREVPDVAALGDPTAQGMLFVDTKSWLDGWLERWVMGGGTSLSAPLWAGFGAVYNQYAATHGQSSLGWANPTLYYLGQHPQQRVGAALRDVTLNGRRTTDLAAPAAPGWDQATGWGSFDAAAFVHDRLDARLVVQPIMEVGGPPGLAVLAVATGFVPGEAVAFSAGPGGSKCSAMADQQGTARCRVAVGQGLAGGSQTFKASDAMAMLQATAVWSAASSL